MFKPVKVRIYPSKDQIVFLNKQFGALRFVYNKSLHIIKHEYKFHNTSLKANKHVKPLLSIAKNSRKYFWLKQYDSIALQESCRNLDKAFNNFFIRKSGFPRFKKKQDKQSSYHCTGISHGDNWIKVPKLKSKIKSRIHRKIDGKLKSITLSKTPTGKYYAVLLYDLNTEFPNQMQEINAEKIIGIDVGIDNILNCSTGFKSNNPRYLSRAANNLRRKQKSLSRKIKGSRRRAQARLLLAKCHEKVANARNDFQHKASKKIVDENQAIIVETLKVKNMLQNRKLAKHIADCAWGNLLTKFEYKSKYSGKHYVKIDQWFASSKTCSCCNHKLENLPLHIRSWVCPECNHLHDRDLNAALNIKNQGIIKLKAEGKSVSASGGLRKTG